MFHDGGFDASETHDIDFLVHGRRSKTKRLTLVEKKAQISRTVRRVPEVVVRVSGGGKTLQHVYAHMKYITRNGKLDAVNDQGEVISGKEAVYDLHDAWDLDVSNGQGKYKQAFNIVLSMPVGTDPNKLLKAVQSFAMERFYGERQYMMVLHTKDTDPHKDAPEHPHVHLIIKAESFKGKRIYIRKATLEEWRSDFAEKLREQGIEANATPRDLRGITRKSKKASVYHAERSDSSIVLANKFNEAKEELLNNTKEPKPWEMAILKKRAVIMASLQNAADKYRREGDEVLASAIEKYAKDLPKPETERHQIKKAIANQLSREQKNDISIPAKKDKER